MAIRYTLCVFSENLPGVLQRITTIFTRRKINIESLTVSETEKPGVSRYTIVVQCERAITEKVADQIRRVIEVLDVYVCDDEELVFKEVALYKVAAVGEEKRRDVEELARRYGAAIVFSKPGQLVLEMMGAEREVQALYAVLEPFGMLEFVHSGRIAILKEPREDHAEYRQGTLEDEEAKSFI
jgi:acetolactate synthase I/III small subunit